MEYAKVKKWEFSTPLSNEKEINVGVIYKSKRIGSIKVNRKDLKNQWIEQYLNSVKHLPYFQELLKEELTKIQ